MPINVPMPEQKGKVEVSTRWWTAPVDYTDADKTSVADDTTQDPDLFDE